jgi:hypothetical protein
VISKKNHLMGIVNEKPAKRKYLGQNILIVIWMKHR